MTRVIETGTENLMATVDDGGAVITMHRPERRNPLTGAMLDRLAAALVDVECADGVRCVVLTGPEFRGR